MKLTEEEQTIDHLTLDKVISLRSTPPRRRKPKTSSRSFTHYIEQHRAEIEALQILYSRPFKQRLTEEGLKELEAKLKQEPQFGLDPVPRLWNAFQISQQSSAKKNPVGRFTDLVSLVRFALEQEPVLEPFEEHVNQRFAEWVAKKSADGTTFGADHLAWLEKMRDYISASGSVDREHLEADNVLGPIYRAFGERLWPLMEELNLTLAA